LKSVSAGLELVRELPTPTEAEDKPLERSIITIGDCKLIGISPDKIAEATNDKIVAVARATNDSVDNTMVKTASERPVGTGQPQVWASGRGSLCEALPYYKSHKSSLYTQDVMAQAILVDEKVDQRDVFWDTSHHHVNVSCRTIPFVRSRVLCADLEIPVVVVASKILIPARWSVRETPTTLALASRRC
jgi:hypothetical protein